MDRIKQIKRKTYSALLLGAVALTTATLPVYAGGVAREGVDPPASLFTQIAAIPADDQAAQRLGKTWQQVLDTVEPAPMPELNANAQAIGRQGQLAALMVRADEELARGGLFAAIDLLREAEAQLPENPEVIRRLGLAYSLSGNRIRGAEYLERSLANRPDDAEALMFLCQHTAVRGELPKTITYADALENQGAPTVLVDYYRAVALEKSGHKTAAADRLSHLLIALERLQGAFAPKLENDLGTLLIRELRVLKKLETQLTIELGDHYLALGQYESADRLYAQIESAAAVDRSSLFDRRVYVALKLGRLEQAVDRAVAQLGHPDAKPSDAEIIGYLVNQGVSTDQLSRAIDAAIADRGASMPLLAGLSKVAEKQLVLAAAQNWLAQNNSGASSYREVIGLIDFDDEQPNDAALLAALLVQAAEDMDGAPAEATAYAKAVVQGTEAHVTLLRAVRHPLFADQSSASRQLLTAIAYERTRRTADAMTHYQRVLSLAPAIASHARLPLARLLLDAGRPDDALAILQHANEQSGRSDWQLFELTVKAIAAMGDTADAIELVDAWRNSRDRSKRSTLLRIELTAMSGSPQQACSQLLRMLNASPRDLELYQAGLDLIDRYDRQFNNLNEAANIRASFISRLNTNLPDSLLAKIERALDLYSIPERKEEAENLLHDILAKEPGNTLALTMLIRVYELAGDKVAADEAYIALLDAAEPGIEKSLAHARRSVSIGEMSDAAKQIRMVWELDRQGVMPGPAMTGDQAASMLQLLSSAEPDADLESQSLAMVRRFPDSVQLNNALGYQWAVQGKNLLQAKAMIQRAIDKDTHERHSIMDSKAWVQYKLGQFEEAEATQRRAIELLRQEQLRSNEQLRASKAVLYDHMGDIMYRRGEAASAIRHWQIARAQRLEEEDLLFDPELRTLAKRVDAKIDAIRNRKEPHVEPIPGPEAHGPEGHPAELPAENAQIDNG